MTTKKLTHSAQEVLVKLAKHEAKNYRAAYVEPDHVALALLRTANPNINTIFNQLNVNLKRVVAIFESLIECKIHPHGGAPVHIRYDSQIHRMLKQASNEADILHQQNIHEEHLLLAVLADDKSALYQCLSKFDLSYTEIQAQLKSKQILNHHPSKALEQEKLEHLPYCINLNQRVLQASAAAQSITARDQELNQIIRILKRHSKNNPLLLGYAGVGKTAIIEALVDKINRNEVPPFLYNSQVYELNIAALLAGTRYRGDFEERLNQVVELFEANNNLILFIDEIHLIAGAGSSQESPLDMANILKPALARGRFRCIGATTHQEYQQYIQSDAALERRFQQVQINEPSNSQMLDILRKVKTIYQQAHHVHYPEESLKQIIALSQIHFPNRFMPDKAIDLMDEVGAVKNLCSYGNDAHYLSNVALDQQQPAITLDDIFVALANKLKVNPPFLNQAIPHIQADLLAKVHTQIVGNQHIIPLIVHHYVRSFRSTLFRPKPLLSLLLSGPQLIGKKTLLHHLTLASHPDQEIFYFLDMAQYNSSQSIEDLFAEPTHSYQHQPHNFIQAIKEHPQLVIYFDNIGMAHESFFPKLKTLLTKGKVISSAGHHYYLYNCIVVVASSLEQYQNRTGFVFDQTPVLQHSPLAIDRFLAQKLQGFLSQLVDYSFNFNPLTKEDLNQLFQLQWLQLETQLQAYTKAKLQATSQLATTLIEQARMQPDQLVKLFEHKVERPLWHFLLDNHQHNQHHRLLIDYLQSADSITITAKENAS